MKYELTTLKDVFDKVPADRIQACLHELSIGMRQAKGITGLLDATATELVGHEVGMSVEWPEICTWIDDGKGEIELQYLDEQGASMFDFVVQTTGNSDERAEQAYRMLEARKDAEIKRLRNALEFACCGIDTAYADIELDCIDKAKEVLTRHSQSAETVLRHNP